MRIVFMGTPEFSVPILLAIAAQHEIAAAYTQPPRPAGRGKADRPSAVHIAAEKLGIPVHFRAADDYQLGPDSQPKPGVPAGKEEKLALPTSRIFPGADHEACPRRRNHCPYPPQVPEDVRGFAHPAAAELRP